VEGAWKYINSIPRHRWILGKIYRLHPGTAFLIIALWAISTGFAWKYIEIFPCFGMHIMTNRVKNLQEMKDSKSEELEGQSNVKNSKKLHVLKKRRIAMFNNEEGKIGWILLWALGIPIPILVVLFLLRGCT